MSQYTRITSAKFYVIIPSSMMTESLGKSILSYGIKPCNITIEVNEVTVPSGYFMVGSKRPFLDCLKGFKKLSREQAVEIVEKIRAGTVQLSDVYVMH